MTNQTRDILLQCFGLWLSLTGLMSSMAATANDLGAAIVVACFIASLVGMICFFVPMIQTTLDD